MTIPMDNSVDHLSLERAQRLLEKNVELNIQLRKAARDRTPSDHNAWQQMRPFQNVELENKLKKAAQDRTPDHNAWQHMRENYEAIILENHAFSKRHEIEHKLWQLHHRRIEELRACLNAALSAPGPAKSENGKGLVRGGQGPDQVKKIRMEFKMFLSEATGFYHDLMLKIRAKYGLPLGYFSDDPENKIMSSKDGSNSADMKNCRISCHQCLIYLGDLARYKSLYGEGDSKALDFSAASSYYMQASSLWPASGSPHHQLAILANYCGDELVATYRYFRSLSAEIPVLNTARDNLIIAFERNRQKYLQLLRDARSSVKAPLVRGVVKGRGKGDPRLPQKEEIADPHPAKVRASSLNDVFKVFSTRFVRLNGILFTRTSLETFGEVLSVVKSDLLELLCSGPDEKCSFGLDDAECRLAVVRLVAILIFTVYNVNREAENQSYAEILQRPVLLQNAYTAVFEFMGHVVERCGQLNEPAASYLLPGIMVFVEWLACHEDIAVGNEPGETQAKARSFFWSNCVLFLNKLLSSGSKFIDEDEDETCFFKMSKYDEAETGNCLALPEDFELRGFLPLVPAQLILDFSRSYSLGGDGGSKGRKVRIQRLVAAGKALANVVRVGQYGVYFDTKSRKFVIGSKTKMSDDYWPANTSEISKAVENKLEDPVPVVGALPPNNQACTQGGEEDEDEVIVFQPAISENLTDGLIPNMTTAHIPVSLGANAGINTGSVLSSGFDRLLQSGFNPMPSCDANSDAQHVSFIQSNCDMWSLGQSGFSNGLANLNLKENGCTKLDLQDYSRVTQDAAYSVPFPQSISFTSADDSNNINNPVQLFEGYLETKLNSIPVPGLDCTSSRPASIASTGTKKNPVTRPIRHLGPPPGFGSVAFKATDDSSSAMSLNYEHTHTPIDDYRWLDGYQLPSTIPDIGLNSSIIDHSMHQYHLANKSNSNSMGMVGFPFPGKQVPSMYPQTENKNGWPELQMSEQMKMYQEQHQQQLRRGNQQTAALPQQYQEQSLWEGGRFFV